MHELMHQLFNEFQLLIFYSIFFREITVPQYDNYKKISVTHLWQKFRENNVFTKEVTKELI